MFELGREIHGLPVRPPITMSLIAANGLLFFRPQLLFRDANRLVANGAMWPSRVLGLLSVALRNSRYRWANLGEVLFRLVVHPCLHFDGKHNIYFELDINTCSPGYHLYYNMTSLLWQGVQLEYRVGSQGENLFGIYCALTLSFGCLFL